MSHFTAGEFACRCGSSKCDAAPMKPAFMEKLERLRVEWGRPMIITSGRRCAAWNKRVGGSPKSQHLYGNACDVHLPAPMIPDFVLLAEKYGFLGIGTGPTFVHIDARQQRARWTYGI
jgi:uncharacterized protein YcbK (DUF882 family)